MSKHTPGPWSYGICGDLSHYTIHIHQADEAAYTPEYSDVAFQTCSGERRAIQEANARLIAAAPDLLEALQRVLDECIFPNDRISSVEKQARAAIAKATGSKHESA